MIKYIFLSAFLFGLITPYSGIEAQIKVKGTFMPSGPPTEAPVRKEFGKGCIIELKQSYKISGTLSGSLEIDYRILVDGPCGELPGTYQEEWIASGSFNGKVEGVSRLGNFTYTAKVKAGGDVEGTIVIGQGIDGELKVKGNFKDGKLSYEGWINEN